MKKTFANYVYDKVLYQVYVKHAHSNNKKKNNTIQKFWRTYGVIIHGFKTDLSVINMI